MASGTDDPSTAVKQKGWPQVKNTTQQHKDYEGTTSAMAEGSLLLGPSWGCCKNLCQIAGLY